LRKPHLSGWEEITLDKEIAGILLGKAGHVTLKGQVVRRTMEGLRRRGARK